MASRLPARRARAKATNGCSSFRESGPEPLLKALIDGGAGIEALAIERPGLHDAFVAIAGGDAAAAMGSRRRRHDALLRGAFVIARRDFAATVLSKTFLFFLLGPLFPLLLGGVSGGIGASVASADREAVRRRGFVPAPTSPLSMRRATQLGEAVGDDALVRSSTMPGARYLGASESDCLQAAIRRSARF